MRCSDELILISAYMFFVCFGCVIEIQVRETSRKPDEMYTLLERLSPGTRKIEVGMNVE